MTMRMLRCLGKCRKNTKHDKKVVHWDEEVFGQTYNHRREYFGCRRCGASRDVKHTKEVGKGGSS